MLPSDLTSRHLAPGLSVKPLAMGCWPIGGPTVNRGRPVGWSPVEDRVALDGLRASLEHGANLFHVADVFGHGRSERLLGQVLKQTSCVGVRIAGTTGYVHGTAPHPYAVPHLRHQVEQSLANLGVVSLDLLLLHTLDFGPGARYLEDALVQLDALRESGLVRAVGIRGPHLQAGSQQDLHGITRAFLDAFALVNPDTVWSRASPLSPPVLIDGEDIVGFTARHGASLILTEPLAQGLLTGKHHPLAPPLFQPGDHRRHMNWYQNPGLRIITEGLIPLRERFGEQPSDLIRVALRHSLQQPDHTVVVAGFTSEAQVKDLFRLGDPLTDDELQFATAVYTRIREQLNEAGGSHRHQLTI
ncbi:aldo/keto reductase [Streptomyces sp. NPDC051555]|uniref:aldo/keto reductase n=1 Tax=Streptomyces sp. NPDC051555 TaxID=3365657 RepID=UPI00379FB870